MPNLITIDLDALPAVITESLRSVLAAHGVTDPQAALEALARPTGTHVGLPLVPVIVEVGRNGAQAVAAATQLRSTDAEADALVELAAHLEDEIGRAATPAYVEQIDRWCAALSRLTGGLV